MKKTFFIFSQTLISFSTAFSIDRTQEILDQIIREWNAVRNRPRQLPSIQMNQTFYGCHCRNFAKNPISTDIMLATRGRPVDEVDKACMYLHNGWSCLASVDNCAINTDYVRPATFMFLPGEFDNAMEQCDNLNAGDDCKKNLCRVELFFNLSIFNLMFAEKYNSDMTDANGFSAEMECPILKGDCDSRKCCINDYPRKDVMRVCKPSSCPV